MFKSPEMAEKSRGLSSPGKEKHLIPCGDSPYAKAKLVQLVEKDPSRAVPLFWSAINSGDRVDSALKDIAVVMKQMNRAEEAIEAIKSFRGLCSLRAQESLDNVLLDLYKRCGRIGEQIDLLKLKLKMIDEGVAFGGRMSKTARSQGKKFHVTIQQEKSRVLGNLAWAYMQCEKYKEAEPLYRRALEIEKDFNKVCNLAICLMQTGRVAEGKILLRDVKEPAITCNGDSYQKSYERAWEMMEKGIDSLQEEKFEGKASSPQEAFLSPVPEKGIDSVYSAEGPKRRELDTEDMVIRIEIQMLRPKKKHPKDLNSCAPCKEDPVPNGDPCPLKLEVDDDLACKHNGISISNEVIPKAVSASEGAASHSHKKLCLSSGNRRQERDDRVAACKTSGQRREASAIIIRF